MAGTTGSEGPAEGLDGLTDGLTDGLAEGLGGAGLDVVRPVGSSHAAESPPAPAPPRSADVHPTAANPVAPRRVSAASPPHSGPFRPPAEACARPLLRRRVRDGAARCTVMVVQAVTAM
ncbi:hypothetical protein GCM10022232_59990 [Streptomyces plumbiresistens]|uniref:Uncharacterized protein n=1 Tax=Streptomyces plumbiresistens TaxID=511811 RepID=A0ABP7SF40_9ACTN